jgi:carboxypeptidase PM20D1
MRKLLRLLFRFSLVVLAILAGIVFVKTIGFSSRQVPVSTVPKIEISDTALDRFSRAIQLPTVSEASRFDSSVFRLQDTLIVESFPLIDSFLELRKFNAFSRLYKWSGKNPGLAPILLMAHTDVVPIEMSSLDKWTEKPYSGKIKDGFIWGRGALDDKNNVFAILETIESLLQEDYIPERTVYLAFGHDEEVSGLKGAKAMAEYLEKEAIRFEYILDEGQFIIEGVMSSLSKPLAMIGTAEKGYVTLDLMAQLPKGGHSAMPPKQTAIGILSSAINELQNHPFPAKIDGATADMFSHAGPEMNTTYKALFANLWLTKGIVKSVLSADEGTNAMIRTTTAPTIIRGGIKDNVLPTSAMATINFRILPGETVQSVKDYVEKTINDDRILVSVQEASACDPSLVSGTNTFGYQVLQKSVLEVYPDIIVAPSLVIGATDSRHMAALSDQIYRFSPIQIGRDELNGFHGINERLSVENYKQMIRFYRQLILNSCK